MNPLKLMGKQGLSQLTRFSPRWSFLPDIIVRTFHSPSFVVGDESSMKLGNSNNGEVNYAIENRINYLVLVLYDAKL